MRTSVGKPRGRAQSGGGPNRSTMPASSGSAPGQFGDALHQRNPRKRSYGRHRPGDGQSSATCSSSAFIDPRTANCQSPPWTKSSISQCPSTSCRATSSVHRTDASAAPGSRHSKWSRYVCRSPPATPSSMLTTAVAFSKSELKTSPWTSGGSCPRDCSWRSVRPRRRARMPRSGRRSARGATRRARWRRAGPSRIGGSRNRESGRSWRGARPSWVPSCRKPVRAAGRRARLQLSTALISCRLRQGGDCDRA